MRALIITSSLPRHPNDVAGAFVAEHARMMQRLGWDTILLTWQSDEVEAPLDDLDIVRIPYAPRPAQRLFFGAGAPENLARNPALGLLLAPALVTMLAAGLARASDVDLIIGHWLVPGGLIARLIGHITGVPSLVIGHSAGVHALARLPSPLAHFVTRGPTTLPTSALREKLARHTDCSGVEVAPMGAPEVKTVSKGRDWLVLSRLVPIKNVELAVRGFGVSGVDATLHVAGDGPERERLERIARDYPNIIFHGWVTGDEKHALLERCGHQMLTSIVQDDGRHEGLPVSLLEAQLAGILPLVAPSPGLDEAVFDPSCVVADYTVQTWSSRIRERASLQGEVLEKERARARTWAIRSTWAGLEPRWSAILQSAVASGEPHVVRSGLEE